MTKMTTLVMCYVNEPPFLPDATFVLPTHVYKGRETKRGDARQCGKPAGALPTTGHSLIIFIAGIACLGVTMKKFVAKNANEVLPASIVADIQRYFRGGVLYIPVGKYAVRDLRRREVLMLSNTGITRREIAVKVGLSQRQVYQILADDRKRAKELYRSAVA